MPITEEQRQLRGGKIGSSDIAGVRGHSPYTTPAKVYAKVKGLCDGPIETTAMRVGTAMEPIILNEFNLKHGVNFNEYNDTLYHPSHEFLICHCDGVNGDQTELLEIKNVGHRVSHHWGPDGDPVGVPLYVLDQCVFQSFMTGIMTVWVCAYFGGNDIRSYKIVFSKKDHNALEDDLLKFWGYVERSEVPPLGATDAKSASLYWPQHSTGVTASIIDNARVLGYTKNRQKKQDAEEEMLKYEASLKQSMKDSEELLDDKGNVIFTWRTDRRGNRSFRCKIRGD